ncbi:MAG: hypothetical protein HYR74_10675 [Candidatus Eisenbacteria bacterium]|nr:hypothetical protein [Candidatus Eisenbacteria bacterium]
MAGAITRLHVAAGIPAVVPARPFDLVTDLSLHLAPNAPALWLALVSLGLIALAAWAYRFAIPPLPALMRRLLPALRAIALLVLVWLLAQPVLERARAGHAAHVVILLDRSRSMDLPSVPGGPPRAGDAAAVVAAIEKAWRGRAIVRTLPFAATLGADSASIGSRGASALGEALGALPLSPDGQDLDAVVVVSDGAVNAGGDPVAASRALGVPVHTVRVGGAAGEDRAVTEVEASTGARVGEATPVRVHVTSTEPRGATFPVRLFDGARSLGETRVVSPGPGAEAIAEFRVTPVQPGLAVWTARVDPLARQITTANDARETAVEVAPGRLGVLMVSDAFDWDLGFVHRALLADSGLSVTSLVRDRAGWREAETGRIRAAPSPADLHGRAVVVLDGLNGSDLGETMDAALDAFAHDGGGLLVLGGSPPGLARLRGGRLGQSLMLALGADAGARSASPEPTAEAREVMSWDDDPERGDQAWRAVAPLADLAPIMPGGGDRVMIAARGGGPPLMLARRVGRGQALLVNGTGLWRWSLSGHDDLSAERGRRLWRRIVRWLAEPVQGEPLRVRPERWLVARGEPARLFASLQGADFKPVAGATVEGEISDAAGHATRIAFAPRAAGSYEAVIADPEPGRYRIGARATRAGAELGRATSEFAVDRWSLEEARAEPDSATLDAIAAATGGRATTAAEAAAWAAALPARTLARMRGESHHLWESPWVFGVLIGLLGVEWAWRRRRGLP